MPISSRADSTNAEDLNLIARAVGLVVLQWSQAEQSLELLVASLWQSFSGHRFAKRIPVLLGPKLQFIKACIAGTPSLKPLESRVFSLLAEFERLSALRHDFVHGAPASIAAVDDHFVFVRLDVHDGFHHTREIRIPIEQYPKLVDSLIALGREAHQMANEVFEMSKKLDLTPLRPAALLEPSMPKPIQVETMQFEDANADDYHAIAEVHIESWQHAYKAFLPAPYLASLSVTTRAAGWRRMLERSPGHVLLVRHTNQVVGFIAFGESRDQDASPARAEVFALYVKPAFWSAGVGRQLWLAALQQLRKKGYESVSLWVIAGNVRAIKFYERAGFVAEPLSRKQFELGGAALEEVRYVLSAIAQPASRTVA